MLGNLPDVKASDWYICAIKMNKSITHEELKGIFLPRFNVKLVDPLVEFCRLKYDSSHAIQNYFERKLELEMNTQLNEKQIITLMIDGL